MEFRSKSPQGHDPRLTLVGKRVVLAGVVPGIGSSTSALMEALNADVTRQGATVLDVLVQRRGVSRSNKPGGIADARSALPLDPATFIGAGKVLELQQMCALHLPDVIVFLNPLSGTQRRNLERLTGVVIVTRS